MYSFTTHKQISVICKQMKTSHREASPSGLRKVRSWWPALRPYWSENDLAVLMFWHRHCRSDIAKRKLNAFSTLVTSILTLTLTSLRLCLQTSFRLIWLIWAPILPFFIPSRLISSGMHSFIPVRSFRACSECQVSRLRALSSKIA